MKYVSENHRNERAGRSPCGERGLKFQQIANLTGIVQSLPVRGAWIEISRVGSFSQHRHGRSPCGERGLKSFNSMPEAFSVIVAPRAGSVD